MKNKTKAEIASFIDMYKVVNLEALRRNFRKYTPNTIHQATTFLWKSNTIKFKSFKKNDLQCIYFSNLFNPTLSKDVFGHSFASYMSALSLLGDLRNFFQITYESPAYFPVAVKFGFVNKGEPDAAQHNAQIITVPFSYDDEAFKKIGVLLDKNYDDMYKPYRFVLLESRALTKGDYPQRIAKYIPRIAQFAIFNPEENTYNYFTPQELGVTNTV